MAYLTHFTRFCVFLCCCMGWYGLFAQTSTNTFPKDHIFTPHAIPTHGKMPCVECDEKGMTQSELDPLVANKKRRAKHTQIHKPKVLMVKCKVCDGAKTVYRKLNLNERIEASMKLRAAFDKEHQTAYRKRLGSAYADAEYLDGLLPEAFAKLAAQYPEACKKCYGLGMTPCAQCDATGRIQQKEVDETGETIYKRVSCTACGGDGGKSCKTCAASGLLRPCKRCDGVGVVERPARRDSPATLIRCKSCLGMGRR